MVYLPKKSSSSPSLPDSNFPLLARTYIILSLKLLKPGSQSFEHELCLFQIFMTAGTTASDEAEITSNAGKAGG
jgi:hypothetical protein